MSKFLNLFFNEEFLKLFQLNAYYITLRQIYSKIDKMFKIKFIIFWWFLYCNI